MPRSAASRLRFHALVAAALAATTLASVPPARAGDTTTLEARIADALRNAAALGEPGRVGYATVWDGNRWIQCRRVAKDETRCEAAGTRMQPSLARALGPEQAARLEATGWTIDPAFGNRVRLFAAAEPPEAVAAAVHRALIEGYGASDADIEIGTTRVADVPCPPRAGPSQNLAGSVNDAPSMRDVVVSVCALPPAPAPTASDDRDAVALWGGRVTAEIQRLRINAAQRVYAIFDPGLGYVQCMPDGGTRTLYCEAQSPESWPALAAVLTPERKAKLDAGGWRPPGRSPNYWRTYPLEAAGDRATAEAILGVLRDVYGYSGKPALTITTERQ